MKRRCARRKTNMPADLSCQTAMTISRFCSCAYAMTGWGSLKKQKNIMKKQEYASRIRRPIFITNGILTACNYGSTYAKAA